MWSKDMSATLGSLVLLPWFAQDAFGLLQFLGPGSRGLSPRAEAWTNPIADGWYADPDGLKFDDTYWVYATVSISFGEQTWFDAFSSPDLVHWTKQPHVFDAATASWAKDSFWAPCTVEHNGTYYFYYTANNPVAAEQTNGIGVAAASSPGGPFIDILDHPLVPDRVNEANPMDQQVFIDDDGKYYLVWGGSRVNIAPLGDDMASLTDWADGSTGVKDITPNEGFGEGSFLLKRGDTYYFMWSEGGYGTPDYRVAYAMSSSITGPFDRIGLILSKDEIVADGPGHHSIFKDDDGEYYIVYHRRIIGDDVADNRVIAVDRFFFNEDGTIKPVVMT
jgi:beta-xylosidase